MQQRRNTPQRQLILQTVQALHHHPTAEDIYTQIHAQYPSISRGTVYRNLNLLAEEGVILRVSHLDSADRFDFETRPHYHFHCKACNGVFDVPLPYQLDLLENVAGRGGFVYEACEITFSGLCPHCAQNHGGPKS